MPKRLQVYLRMLLGATEVIRQKKIVVDEPTAIPASVGVAEPLLPISVIVPCYRCKETIAVAVASVATQLELPSEVILVDDFSCDGTLEMLQEISRGYSEGWIKVVQTPKNAGPSGARNLGWDVAAQPYIAFLDSDDSWHPMKLKLQYEALSRDPAIALIAHEMNVQPPEYPAPLIRSDVKMQRIERASLLLGNPFPTASVILRRNLPFRFDERKRRVEDYFLWAQILSSGRCCMKINQVLASWHKAPYGAGGLSGDILAMHKAGSGVWRELYEKGYFSYWEWRFVIVLRLLKFFRRYAMVALRRR